MANLLAPSQARSFTGRFMAHLPVRRMTHLIGHVLVIGLLAGCAGYSPSSVRPVMGEPTARHPQPLQAKAGVVQRLEFARGPLGRHTYMLDFDANQRLVSWQQVLTEETFSRLTVGMPQQQVLQTIGHPSSVRSVRYQGHTIWSYRYENPFCIWFEVSIDREGRVAETGHGPDPACERPWGRP